jgi:multidrug resistance efflux pump
MRRGGSQGPRWRRLILPTAAIILVLVVAIGRTELRVSGPVSVLPEKNADIRSEVEGIVETVFVDEGDRVQVGDLLARLSGHALVNDLEATMASIRETSATLEKLEAGPTPAEIAVQRAAVEKAKDQANYASMRLSKLKQAFVVEAVSAREFEDAQQLASTAEHDLDEAQRQLDVLTVGTRREDIDEARAKIEGLRAHGRFLQDQVGRLEVRSPVAGVVATPSRQLKAMEGQLVPSGGLIAKVYEFETVAALITISEKEIGDVRPGLPVELRSRAYPDLTFHGRVTSVAVAADASLASEGTPPPTPSSSPGRTFMVTCRLDNRSLQLKPGMTGQAKVLCGSCRNWNLARRQLARFFKVEVWSWW